MTELKGTDRENAIRGCQQRIEGARRFQATALDHHDAERWGRIIESNEARLAELKACERHPAFEADNCPGCGTAVKIGGRF